MELISKGATDAQVQALTSDDKLRAGRYMLRPNMTMGQIMAALQTGMADGMEASYARLTSYLAASEQQLA